MGFIKAGEDGLFDLGAGEAGAGGGQVREIEVGRILLAPGQMDAQDVGAHRFVGQVDEKDLVEATLAQQLRRQALDVVGGDDQEEAFRPLGHPGEQGAEHALRDAAVGIAAGGGDALLDLVHPQHAGRHGGGHLQHLAQVALGLAVELVVERAEIQAEQRQLPGAGHRLGGEALAGALHAQQ